MASWNDFSREAPGLASRAQTFLDARRHKTIATLRRGGAPRLSGTETFFHASDIWFGSMWRSQKALDLRRDPRFALHSGSEEPPDWRGDVSISGSAIEIDDATVKAEIAEEIGGASAEPWPLFRAELGDVVVVQLAGSGEHLDIDIWTPGSEVRRIERA